MNRTVRILTPVVGDLDVGPVITVHTREDLPLGKVTGAKAYGPYLTIRDALVAEQEGGGDNCTKTIMLLDVDPASATWVVVPDEAEVEEQVEVARKDRLN